MTRILRFVVFHTFFLSLVAMAATPVSAGDWVPDELLVGRKPGVSRGQAEAVFRDHGASTVAEIPQIAVHVIKVSPQALERVERALSRRPELEFVERNRRVAPNVVPNDPEYGSAWHLPKIRGPEAWALSQGSPEVVIAILDSGVDGAHPDLVGKLVSGWNFYDGNSDTSDVYGHGTQVAGAAAAMTDNATGVAGVSWLSGVMPLRVTDTRGWGYYSLFAQALTWAVDNGARVMNLSFEDVAGSATVRSAAQYVRNHGGVVVAAAGNCGCTELYADEPDVISVGATTSGDTLASFSANGAHIDVAAPGEGIRTTFRGGGYGSISGTSFSSPITAGVIALMMAANPSLAPADLEYHLESTALDLGETGWDPKFGFGRVDAYAAVASARNAGEAPAPDTTPPAATIESPQGGATVSGTVTVGVTAFDDVGVARVELYADGILIATDTTSPWSFSWDTGNASDGGTTLEAVAYDAAGNNGTSDAVTVTVENAAPDLAAPTVAVVSPQDGASVSRTVSISVSASDDVQVQTVELYVDGSLFGSAVCGTASCSPSFSWNTRKESSGTHVLAAKAFDAAGNERTSASVNVSIGSGGGGGKGGPKASTK